MVERADTHRYNKLALERKSIPGKEPAHQKLSTFSCAIGRSESVATVFTGSGAGSGNSSETGARIMTLSGEKWLRTLLTALTVLIAPVSSSTLLAQGYGPDPFKPYNSQYLPYTFPMGPASPAGGGRSDLMMRMGNAGANQYQGYLDELSGQARQGSERYGIGMPYYRSAVDPKFDPEGKREYRPNQKADQSFDETREVVTRKYLAYLTEHDPKKRADLLRDYNATRGRVSRAMSARRDPSARLLEAASGSSDAVRRRPAATTRGAEASERNGVADEAPRSSVRGPSISSSRRTGTGSIPPAPPLTGAGFSRRTAPRRSPEDVLKRARRLDGGDDVKPRAGAPAGAGSDSGRRALPAPLPPE
jgi:hypothetical protein